MIALAAKILTIASITFTGMYFVTDMVIENAVLKFEKRQEKRQKEYNDSLEVSRREFVKEIAEHYDGDFTLEEQAQITKQIVSDGIKSLKRFVKSENKLQEEQFEVFYFLDHNDSTFKLLTYEGRDGNIIVREIPISTSEFNKINN